MKNRLLASIVLALFCNQVSAADRYWDNDATAAGNNATTGAGLGGTGTWDTSSLKWWDGVSSDVAWINANNDNAIFSGQTTSGGATTTTVTLSSGATMTANSLIFAQKFISPATAATNYVITGGTAINLTSGTITAPTGNSANATINTPLNVTGDLVLISNNTTAVSNGIALGAVNSISGNIVLKGGGIPVASSWALKLNLNVANAIPSTATINFERNQSQVNFNSGTTLAFGTLSNNFVINSSNLAYTPGATGSPGSFEVSIGALVNNTATLSGLISGNGDLRFGAGLSGGAGIITLTNQNTYTGGATRFLMAATGVVKVGVDNALATTAGLSFGTGATASGGLDLNGFNQTVAYLASPATTGAVNGIVNTAGATTMSTLTINGNATSTYTGPLGTALSTTNLPGTAAALANIKLVLASTNTGKLTVGGTTTGNPTNGMVYSGGTEINGGTLVVVNTTGSGTGTGAVTVNNGGTLAGTGSVSGAVTVNTGGKLSPGTSIESLAVGSPLTLNTGSTMVYEINSSVASPYTAAADLVNVAGPGALSISTSANLTTTDLAATSVFLPLGTKFTLVSYTSFDTTTGFGNFAGKPDNSTFLLGANEWQIAYQDSVAGANFNSEAVANGTKFVTITVVPEANGALLGGLVCLVVGIAVGGRRLLQRRAVAVSVAG